MPRGGGSSGGRSGMYILGLSAFSHDSAAALVEGGEIKALVEEERLNRCKHTTAFPSLAIDECLRMEGVSPESIDHFAFFNRPDLELWSGLSHGIRYFPKSMLLFLGTHGGDAHDGGSTFVRR